MFGTGVGFGDAYRLSTIAFEKEKSLAKVLVKVPEISTTESE
jgi:hypothetical protein